MLKLQLILHQQEKQDWECEGRHIARASKGCEFSHLSFCACGSHCARGSTGLYVAETYQLFDAGRMRDINARKQGFRPAQTCGCAEFVLCRDSSHSNQIQHLQVSTTAARLRDSGGSVVLTMSDCQSSRCSCIGRDVCLHWLISHCTRTHCLVHKTQLHLGMHAG